MCRSWAKTLPIFSPLRYSTCLCTPHSIRPCHNQNQNVSQTKSNQSDQIVLWNHSYHNMILSHTYVLFNIFTLLFLQMQKFKFPRIFISLRQIWPVYQNQSVHDKKWSFHKLEWLFVTEVRPKGPLTWSVAKIPRKSGQHFRKQGIGGFSYTMNYSTNKNSVQWKATTTFSSRAYSSVTISAFVKIVVRRFNQLTLKA